MRYKRNQIVCKISQNGDTIAQGIISNPLYTDCYKEYIQVKWEPDQEWDPTHGCGSNPRFSHYDLKGGPIWDTIVIICDIGVTI